MELQELKNYLRVDFEDDDPLIQSLQVAAEQYITNAGITKDYTMELYKLAVKLLVGHWYDNREVVGQAQKLAYSLESIIVQLKYQ